MQKSEKGKVHAYRPSNTTKVVVFRLPVEDWNIADRRAKKHPRYHNVNEYLKHRNIYDIRRKHGRKGE